MLQQRRKSKYEQMSFNQLIPTCINILEKSADSRKLEELQILQLTMENIKFFRQLQEEQNEKTFYECLRRMTVLKCQENDIVIEQGEKGKEFYIILSGCVSVYVLKNPPIDLNEHQENRLWFIKAKSFLVQRLLMGESFGELALLNDSPRSASIICESPCIFGILSKKDYKEVLQQAQEEKVKKQLRDFHNCMKQHQISEKLLNILFFSFPNINFKFRQAVYQEGSISKQELYLIQQGEFLIQVGHGNRPISIALLQKGAIFGDHECFNNLEKRIQTVICNSEYGIVLKIQLSSLLQRLQTTNELHLYDQLKYVCEKREKYRDQRQNKNNIDEILNIPDIFVKQRSISYQVNRIRSAQKNNFYMRTPLQMIGDVVKNKKTIYLRLYGEEDYRPSSRKQQSCHTTRPSITELRKRTCEQFLLAEYKF